MRAWVGPTSCPPQATGGSARAWERTEWLVMPAPHYCCSLPQLPLLLLAVSPADLLRRGRRSSQLLPLRSVILVLDDWLG